MKKILFLVLTLSLCLALCACGSNVNNLKEQIEALNGNITLDSGPFIEAAEAAYDALSDAEKQEVTNYAVLVSARSQFDELFKNVAQAIALIETLPKQEDIEFKDGYDILDVWEAYNSLTEKEKTKVTNIEKLETAVETVNKIAAPATQSRLNYTVNYADCYSTWDRIEYKYELVVTPNQDYFRFENVCFKLTGWVILLNHNNNIYEYKPTIELVVSEDGCGTAKTETYTVKPNSKELPKINITSVDVSGEIYFNIGK